MSTPVPTTPRTPRPRTPRTPSAISPRTPGDLRDLSSPLSAISGLSQSSNVPRTPTSTPGGRHDIGGNRGFVQRPARGDFAAGSAAAGADVAAPSSQAEEKNLEIWGSTINIDRSQKRCNDFLNNYKNPTTGLPHYPAVIDEAVATGALSININCTNIYSFDPILYHELVHYPSEIVQLLDVAVHNLKLAKYPPGPDERETARIQVKPFNLKETIGMRHLNPEQLNMLVSIKGMVIRVSDLIPEMVVGFFKCSKCDQTEQAPIEDGMISEPPNCPRCQARFSMQLEHNRCLFSNKQMIKLQETPDAAPEGETPATVTAFVYDHLVEVVKPGDKLDIVGIYRGFSLRRAARQRSVSSVAATFLDVLHIAKSNKKRFQAEDSKAPVSSEFYTPFDESDQLQDEIVEKEAELRKLASEPDIYDKLVRSLAPSIAESHDIKKGILCQLFGGANNEKGARQGRARGEINVLLCGDPGTAKSQLLGYVNRIAPRGLYTSGRGTSAVGLTAHVAKDPTSRELVLESGALVMSDRGICCIDEFDKMSDSTRSILHEAMEQQTVSIAKAGIVATLNARTSVLASANPSESRYNPKLTVVQNLRLPPSLLSRFDLIYLVLDEPDDARDRRVAQHLVALHYGNLRTGVDRKQDVIPMTLLTQYISFARKRIHPVLSEEAAEKLEEEYTKMRSLGRRGGKKIITATPRQLEALIRLSEALSRMKFQEKVTPDEVKEAARLITVATQQAATDPTTGLIDMDAITTGHTQSDRKRHEEQLSALTDLIATRKGRRMTIEALFDQFKSQSSFAVSISQFRELLVELEREGSVRLGGTDVTIR